MALGLIFPLTVYSLAYAQGTTPAPAAAPASASPAPTATTPAATTATTAASPAPAVVPPSPAAAVSVDMTSKPAEGGMNGATYSVRLRDLEQRVDELKDQIRRSHTRLAMISDTILSGGAAGSRAELVFHDEMSSAFLLTQATFVMDNQVQYNKLDDSGALADQKEIPIYTGSVPPGDHTIQVALTFQGNGYGVFSYLRGYKFEVKSSHSFTAVEGKALSVVATAFEKGGVTTPLEQRPTIEWHETLKPLTTGASTAPGAGGPAEPPGGGGKK
ncbi:MAG TPA: hypothetical protein VGM06_00150 [Polyangiaceae bacterium]